MTMTRLSLSTEFSSQFFGSFFFFGFMGAGSLMV